MNKTRYVAISYGVPENATSSQFFEYFSLLKNHGLEFEVLLLLPGSFLRKKGARRLLDERVGRNLYRGPLHCVPAPAMNSIIGLFIQLVFLRLHFGLLTRNQEIVIHARNLVSANIANRFKGRSRKISYVYDVRGDLVGEYEYAALKRGDSADLIAAQKKHLMKLEADTVRNANHIVCVSNALKKLLIARYDIVDPKIVVIPCCADEGTFRYNGELRNQYRQEFKLEGKTVLIYSGGMDKWHCAESIFQIAGQILERNEQAFFVVLTPQVGKAEGLAERYLPRGRYLVNNVTRKDVAKYLLASDAGIVIRENDPVNRVASPTKVAEYLISGLPVILSEGLGDYSDFVTEKKVGIVLEKSVYDIDSQVEQVSNFLESLGKYDKKSVSDLGVEHFSKSRYLEVFEKIYKA